MMTCKFCGRECKNNNAKRNHERLCHDNPDRQIIIRTGSKNPNFGKKAWNRGLTKESNEIVKTISEKIKGKTYTRSEEHKRHQSEILLKASKEGKNVGGLRHNAGRGRKGHYRGIWCDSTWELAYVVWSLDHNKHIERNTKKLPYTLNGRTFFYYPDFLIDNKYLIEIKGYMNDKAKAKALAYPEIEIITYGSIEPYLEYAMKKANNKDLTILYDECGCIPSV